MMIKLKEIVEMKSIIIYIGLFIVGLIIGRGIVVMVQDYNKEKSDNRTVVIDKWNKMYPSAVGKEYYTFCDDNGFLREVRLHSYSIGSENLVRADNDVPIRCNPTTINVTERTGTNRKVF